MRISDWSSDVCSSDLRFAARRQFSTGGLLSRNGQHRRDDDQRGAGAGESAACAGWRPATHANAECADHERRSAGGMTMLKKDFGLSVKDVSDEGTFEGYASTFGGSPDSRSEEHTSELQSLMRISYAVFCLKKKTTKTTSPPKHYI